MVQVNVITQQSQTVPINVTTVESCMPILQGVHGLTHVDVMSKERVRMRNLKVSPYSLMDGYQKVAKTTFLSIYTHVTT